MPFEKFENFRKHGNKSFDKGFAEGISRLDKSIRRLDDQSIGLLNHSVLRESAD